MKNLRWIIPLCILAISGSRLVAEPEIPELKQRVTDFTNTLSLREWQLVDDMLKNFEDTTSTQIVVLMINSLESSNIDEYANKVFEQNKIGQTKKDNGVLLVIAKQDREMRIEVGYGLEGVLTDALSSQIIRNEITPYFKAENYFGGVVTGVDAIMRATAGAYHADGGKEAPAVSIVLVFFAIIFGVFFLLPLIAGRRRSVLSSGGHRYFSGWGYGGGFGSGGGFSRGGGGFRGGGGMSGGGGASGSW